MLLNFEDIIKNVSANELYLLVHHFEKNYESINYKIYDFKIQIVLVYTYYIYMLITIKLIDDYLKINKCDNVLYLKLKSLISILQKYYEINKNIIKSENTNIYLTIVKKLIENDDTDDINYKMITAQDFEILRNEYFRNLNYFITKKYFADKFTYNIIFKLMLKIFINYESDDDYYKNYYINLTLLFDSIYDEYYLRNLIIFGDTINIKLYYNEKYTNKFYIDDLSKNDDINILIINTNYILVKFYLEKLKENPNQTTEIKNSINNLNEIKNIYETDFLCYLKKSKKYKIMIKKLLEKKKFLSNNLENYEFCKKKFLIKNFDSIDNIFQLFVRYYSTSSRFLFIDQTILSTYNFIYSVLLYKFIKLNLKNNLDEKIKKNILKLEKNIIVILSNNKYSIRDLDVFFKYLIR